MVAQDQLRLSEFREKQKLLSLEKKEKTEKRKENVKKSKKRPFYRLQNDAFWLQGPRANLRADPGFAHQTHLLG